MPIDQITEVLRQLRSGKLDAEAPVFLEHLSAVDLVKQMRDHYPVVFQERSIGRKTEFGLARSLQFEVAVSARNQQTFPPVLLFPVFRRCLLISSYDDHLSGIATAKSLRIRPSKANRDDLTVTTGMGYKLDKMPDGWTLKDIPRQSTVLSEAFLRARGWQFDRLRPFAVRSR